MPSEYKHKPWERYFPQMLPLLAWMKPHNIRKAKSWGYTGAIWSLLMGTTLLYLTDWNPLPLIFSKPKSVADTTDTTDPSDNSLYQKVAYGGGFYKFIRPNSKNSIIDDSSKSAINEGDNIRKVDKSNVKPQKVKNLMDKKHNVLLYRNKRMNNDEVTKLEVPTESNTIENTPDIKNNCDSHHHSGTKILKITIETINE